MEDHDETGYKNGESRRYQECDEASELRGIVSICGAIYAVELVLSEVSRELRSQRGI